MYKATSQYFGQWDGGRTFTKWFSSSLDQSLMVALFLISASAAQLVCKGCGMYNCVCRMVHLNYPELLIGAHISFLSCYHMSDAIKPQIKRIKFIVLSFLPCTVVCCSVVETASDVEVCMYESDLF